MVAVWLLSVRLHNAGIVDVAWSAAFTPVAIGYAWLAGGWPARDLLLVALVAAWSLRLAWHLYVRVSAEHPHEDSRYAALRAHWGTAANAKMLGFFQVQAVAALILSVPFALVALNPTPGFAPLEWVGVAVTLIGLAGEATADAQLARFRANPANKGRVCQDGLWAWSRHPNYFFEWIIWCGFGIFALGSPQGWLGLHVIPLMFYVMRYGTGVPYAEASSLRSRGDAYREYQRTTNTFIPGPRRTRAI
ncbi:membrane protein [Luteitalea sp. TBR-22]|nr:membrane protein [Luteitalea sp. TBR-22]